MLIQIALQKARSFEIAMPKEPHAATPETPKKTDAGKGLIQCKDPDDSF